MKTHCLVAGLSILAATGPLHAQDKPAAPPAPGASPATAESAEDIAKDAARDLKDTRFFNRPGATRAQYDADWQQCRLIARGALTPTSAVGSPSLVGGIIGSVIGDLIAEGQQRRANRRSCLLLKGWRLVEVPPARAAQVAAMSDAERSAYFDTIVGATQVEGTITERNSFTLAPDPALRIDDPVALPGMVSLGKNVDPAAPFALAPGEAAIVLTYRRPDAFSARRSAGVTFARYDLAARDFVSAPRTRDAGDTTTYIVSSKSGDRNLPYEVQLLRITPGDYAIGVMSLGGGVQLGPFCFGAPTFHIDAGQIAYLGDFIPYWDAKTALIPRLYTVAYATHIEDARGTLATRQPAIAARMTPAVWHNRATYRCTGIMINRWDLPGIEALPDPTPAATTAR